MPRVFYLTLLSYFFIAKVFSQGCPQNLGFEDGNFVNWKTFRGTVSASGGKNLLSLNQSTNISTTHTLLNSKTQLDPYGKFPVLAPNGSGYSLKLGNNGTGGQAESISYLIKIPANSPEFSLTYQYAVVFEDPSHLSHEQPRFNAKVLDVATNQYIQCASFEYIATSGLPGFKKLANSPVLYKDWTTVSLNLSGYQGKEVLLEFTTADCTKSGHFGYAYVDVNEECLGVIRGNEICPEATSITLKGPAGYKNYKWYNMDRTIEYGSSEQVTITPALPNNAKVILDLLPYDGYGCPNTISTTIAKKELEIDLLDQYVTCRYDVVDLTSNKFILNKSVNLAYSYFTDAALQMRVQDPTKVTVSGKYYVVVESLDCKKVKSINLVFNDIEEDLEIITDLKLCRNSTLDLTSVSVQKRVGNNVAVSYYEDRTLKVPLQNPNSIVVAGSYFIKFEKGPCATVKEIKFSFFDSPILKVKDPNPICLNTTMDITDGRHYIGSDADLNYLFYTDLQFSNLVSNPKAIAHSGKYYIKVVNKNGCVGTGSINVIIENPILLLKDPAMVCFPQTVDITDKTLYVGSTGQLSYSYFDLNMRQIANPKAITITGKYYIKGTNLYGCIDIKEINVVINKLPKQIVNTPKKTLEPHLIDITKPEVLKGSSGYSTINYWLDKNLTIPLPNPSALATSGVFYISLTNQYGCIISEKIEITIGKRPAAIVPTAFTPLKDVNSKLYPFCTNLKKLVSFKIFNKWGNLVFETNSMDPKDGWDGHFKGKVQPFETYTWFLDGIDEIDEPYKNKGNTVLIL